jgi:hypothetical protein
VISCYDFPPREMGADITIKKTIGRDGGPIWLVLEDGREVGSTPHGPQHAQEIAARIRVRRKGRKGS